MNDDSLLRELIAETMAVKVMGITLGKEADTGMFVISATGMVAGEKRKVPFMRFPEVGDSLCHATSYALQYGVPLAITIDALRELTIYASQASLEDPR